MPSLGSTTIEIDCERPASAVTLPFRFTPVFKSLGAHSDFGPTLVGNRLKKGLLGRPRHGLRSHPLGLPADMEILPEHPPAWVPGNSHDGLL